MLSECINPPLSESLFPAGISRYGVGLGALVIYLGTAIVPA